MTKPNTQPTPPTHVCFTEDMVGHASLGRFTAEEGAERGQAQNTPLSFRLTIHIDDIDRFIADPAHEARAVGAVDSPLLGGRRPVLKGVFNLFTASGDADRKTMLYRLFLENAQGEPITLSGTKDVRNDAGPDLWADTTTLRTNLYAGHVDLADEPRADLLGAGVLRIGWADFLRQLTTFRSDAPTLTERLLAVERFAAFFAGSLWQLHGLPRRHRLEPSAREIPLRTLQGVENATASTHRVSTADGLGISLLRLQRAPCQDVVLLVPGLTASSDMFTMPEHRNLTNVLHDAGYTDVWVLDGRISNAHPYNLARHRYTVDDVALYDNPAALDAVRQAVGPGARIHVIAHCLGALSMAMSLFAGRLPGVASMVLNGVALTPKVNRAAYWKLHVGPFLAESVLGVDYLNPNWSRQPGWFAGKLLAKGVSLVHRECDVPACHMTSFMWGVGQPVLFRHENLHDTTHRRVGDLFGGSGVHYYRHVLKMLKADNTAVKYDPGDVRYRHLPNNYMDNAAQVETPLLLVAGQQNALFLDSNVLCHQRLERVAPGRHGLVVVPGYGHADVFIGQNAAQDVFPRLVSFLDQHAEPVSPAGV